MDINVLLEKKSRDIVGNAVRALSRANMKHYQADGKDKTQLCLDALYEVTVGCLKRKNATAMIRYAEDMGRERFTSGFGLHEVQTAFNALEEAIWLQVLEDLEATEFFEAMGLVSTVLGMGKDALARTYASLASDSKVPSLDFKREFEQTDGRQSA